ncbi:hypothetical protein N7532_009314 [Penicillium argentinense]|uniref:Atg28p n=1 Tax=Penicillium argentinense TaxID=1131581 RepID=A0A9W9K2R0_9EURO|nr:uncharacterized protein N7532_009314 [Penicillium argentinense]KAJ5090630.1 hypothetical protein N7532_009314 [Penicillium argentinense]
MSTLLPFRDKCLPPVPATASMYHHDPLLYVKRQSNHIQRNLQTLIDAQSEGLLSGLAQHQPDGTSDGSFTPTSSRASRSRSPSTLPARHPVPKHIGLKAARQGIFQSIYDLLKLREEEREILCTQTDERDNALHEIQGFTSTRTGLEETISNIRNNRENQRAKSLQEEARTLETDIRELETRLYEMKARHRHIVSQISHIENSVEAKLSSYTEALSLLQKDIQNYLRDPPVQPLSQRKNESTFYALNPKRRTLEMAQEHWQTEQDSLHKRQQEVDAEIMALEEGGGVWKQAIADISGFEKRLRTSMRRYIKLETQSNTMEESQGGGTKEEIAAGVTADLDQITKKLESYLERAESKDWKLLVCCIAAELEALRSAHKLLLPAFGLAIPKEQSNQAVSPSPASKSMGEESTNSQHADRSDDEHGDLEPPADLLKDSDAHHTGTASPSEDDEPDPAWLLPES